MLPGRSDVPTIGCGCLPEERDIEGISVCFAQGGQRMTAAMVSVLMFHVVYRLLLVFISFLYNHNSPPQTRPSCGSRF